MPALIAALIAALPSLVKTVQDLVEMVRTHADTPAAQKAQLDDIATHLSETAAKVAAVQV